MAEALEICRDYGQPPGWWAALDRNDRALLIADRRERIARHNRDVGPIMPSQGRRR